MSDWIDALSRLAAAAEPCILVTLAEAKGSTPREAGVKMVVTADGAFGSIGGGNLEYQALGAARALLANPDGARSELKRFALGASLGQCCGGHASVLFEPMPAAAIEPWLARLRTLQEAGEAAVLVTAIAGRGETKLVVSADRVAGGLGDPGRDAAATKIARAMLERRQSGSSIEALAQGCSLLFEPLGAARPQVVLFGAGHVGKALVRILAELPWQITWVDGRAEQFPDALPANVTVDWTAAPERAVGRAPPDAIFLVMTHSHALDLKLCEKILAARRFLLLRPDRLGDQAGEVHPALQAAGHP